MKYAGMPFAVLSCIGKTSCKNVLHSAENGGVSRAEKQIPYPDRR